MTEKLVLETRSTADETPHIGSVMLAPPINPDYWSYRVALSDEQAVVGFPKFSTVGIGFQREDADWNTNLPYTTSADEIADHIWENAGPSVTDRQRVIRAIEMIQAAAGLDRADPRPSENTDDIPQWPGFRAAGFFDDLPKLTEGFFTQAELDNADDESDHEPDPNPLDALVAELATTNRHLEAIVHELRLKNRVVGL